TCCAGGFFYVKIRSTRIRGLVAGIAAKAGQGTGILQAADVRRRRPSPGRRAPPVSGTARGAAFAGRRTPAPVGLDRGAPPFSADRGARRKPEMASRRL